MFDLGIFFGSSLDAYSPSVQIEIYFALLSCDAPNTGNQTMDGWPNHSIRNQARTLGDLLYSRPNRKGKDAKS